jgi:ectoine hydroxylase-related dioxygenase (phytanoyl-CoA dioxygenase family)
MISPDRSLVGEIESKGFSVIRHVFQRDEIERLVEQLDIAPLARSRAGARHALQTPAVMALAHDARLTRIVASVLGPAALPYRATLFDKSPDANWLVVWHQDTALPMRERRDVAGWGPWSVKAGVTYAPAAADALQQVLALRVDLDDSEAGNGPLRVIPGSHRYGVLADDVVQRLVRQTEPVACSVSLGGVLAMRPLLVHASSKSRAEVARRVLHIEYAASMLLQEGLELAVA